MIHKVDWPAPEWVKAYTTSNEMDMQEEKSRMVLRQELQLQNDPYWLQQVHGNDIVNLANKPQPIADGSYTNKEHQTCVIRTADCLPVLLCCPTTRQVAAVHVGWRGLVTNILEHTLTALNADKEQCLIWLGPCIGPTAFEVGSDVKDACLKNWPEVSFAFKETDAEHWLCDLVGIATYVLKQQEIQHIYTHGGCTYSDADQWFSYRRDSNTGRMASLVWIEDQAI